MTVILSPRQSRRLWEAVRVVLVAIVALVMMVPIVWIALAAFKQHVDVYQLKLLFRPTLENFALVFDSPYHLGRKLLNSTVVSFVTVAVAIPIATCAAYSFSRFRMRGERVMFVMILATQFVPAVVIVLPFFLLFRDLGILDTRLGLILVNLSIVTPFAIWMIKGFIDGIPRDTEEAALVDGSSRLQVIRNIVLPMAAPGIVTAAIFCFIIAWNDFLFALILSGPRTFTLPVTVFEFMTYEEIDFGGIYAAATLITAPIIFLVLLIQNHFVEGLTMGGLKG